VRICWPTQHTGVIRAVLFSGNSDRLWLLRNNILLSGSPSGDLRISRIFISTKSARHQSADLYDHKIVPMKHEFIKYLEENFYADFKFYDKYVLDKDGNIIEISIGGVDQNPILPDPKNISDLSVFLPLSPYLKVLHIRNCRLDKDMSPIKAFTQLRELSLAYTNLINKITGLENLTELETLDLSGNKIEKIEGLENLTKLKLLDLHSNGLGSEGYIKKVEGLSSLTRLETLYLHHNEIEEIKEIDNLSNLRKLTLSTRLSEFPDLTSLQSLEQLSIDGEFNRVESLSELKHLHTIGIESEKEIENMEELVTNKNLINIEVNSEKIRGDISGIYTHWWDR
jgi:hypothetical protein